MIYLEGEMVIIGDIHGQLFDLLHILEKLPKLPNVTMLFLGDYVDRGNYSLEVLVILFTLKVILI